MARQIDSSLQYTRGVNDSIANIPARPRFVHDEMLISVTAPWKEAWLHGELWTGEGYIDSIGKLYGLMKVDTGWRSSLIILTFRGPLQMYRLAPLYEKYSGVKYAEPNQYCCDGDNIEYFRKNDAGHFVFSIGRGDCPAGCTYRFYWYVSVTDSSGIKKAVLEESRHRSGAKVYRWNIPPRYAMTMFPDTDSILSAIQFSPHWWVRRHAIEGVWRFFDSVYPWVGEDINGHWDILQVEVKSKKKQIIELLQAATTDQDSDVRASAETALQQVGTMDVPATDRPLRDFTLSQNYPNPFNPITRIRFTLAARSHVSLKVYDVLGQEAAVLLDEEGQPGIHSVEWNAERFSSGMYFYTLRAGGFVENKRMVLVK